MKTEGGFPHMIADYKDLIEPVRSKRTFEEVSDKLKELIFNGTLQPGQQLPSETALAQLFQVGRQSVREALRVLEISGFITVRPGVKGGAVIEGTVLSKMANLFLDTFKLQRISLKDCMAARKAIEESVLDLVIKNGDESAILGFRENIEKARARIKRGNAAFEENLDFHRLLAKASRNHTFTIVMESILTVFSDFKSKHVDASLAESAGIVSTHEALLDAIVGKNRKKAVEVLRKDLALAEEILIGKPG
jgi:GntR family transcriptional regulator, transcriptional repressor for pyruvate dehydrogenase complex